MLKKFCQCLGLASLILVMNYGDLLGGGSDVRMHAPYGLAAICLAQIADILLLGLAFFVMLLASSRTRFYPRIRLFFLLLVPPYLIAHTYALSSLALKRGVAPVVATIWIIFLLMLLRRSALWFKGFLRAADTVGIFLAIFGICSIAQLLWVMRWHPGNQQSVPVWMTAAQPARKHSRIIWIVFDELSYDQLFEHRADRLLLPNFDAFRSESTLFTAIQPVGLKTARIIPSLFTGKIIEDLRYDSDNHLTVHYASEHLWQPLDGAGTVFHDAQLAGWRTAAVGWYNPYCTLYGDALDSCYWSNEDRLDGNMAQNTGFWRNTSSPLKDLAIELLSPSRASRRSCTIDVRQRYQTHLDLEQHSRQVVTSDQADLVFLHFDIPHSPNIWSRAEAAYTAACGSSYLDNLALVDHELGLLLTTLRASPRWDDTTVIVQGDHSWRTMLWNTQPAWTSEDEKASRGIFDPRPALLIHDASQTQPQTDPRRLSLLYVHDVIEGILQSRSSKP